MLALLLKHVPDNLVKGCTSFVNVHRLSTIPNADKIVVIDKGIVSEAGTHSELMNQTVSTENSMKCSLSLGWLHNRRWWEDFARAPLMEE